MWYLLEQLATTSRTPKCKPQTVMQEGDQDEMGRNLHKCRKAREWVHKQQRPSTSNPNPKKTDDEHPNLNTSSKPPKYYNLHIEIIIQSILADHTIVIKVVAQ